jgi:hypothetical protein
MKENVTRARYLPRPAQPAHHTPTHHPDICNALSIHQLPHFQIHVRSNPSFPARKSHMNAASRQLQCPIHPLTSSSQIYVCSNMPFFHFFRHSEARQHDSCRCAFLAPLRHVKIPSTFSAVPNLYAFGRFARHDAVRLTGEVGWREGGSTYIPGILGVCMSPGARICVWMMAVRERGGTWDSMGRTGHFHCSAVQRNECLDGRYNNVKVY